MSRKADRTKLSRTAVARAFEDRHAVRVTRTIRGMDPVEGFVAAAGLRWLLIHRISDDLDLDGYTALRWKHVKRATPLGADHVAVRALAHQRLAPLYRHAPVGRRLTDPTRTRTRTGGQRPGHCAAGPGRPRTAASLCADDRPAPRRTPTEPEKQMQCPHRGTHGAEK